MRASLAALTLVAASSFAVAQAPPVFRSEVAAVYVDVFVSDGEQPREGLSAADFALKDNGVVQEITQFTTDVQPLSTMILIDEGWKALDDEVFAARIRDWLKTLRKRNALVGFATQSARDALDSKISTALVEQTATMIFMPNARARAEDYCDGFGLTGHELDLIRTLPAHSRCFLVRQPDASVVVRLDLSGMPDVMTVLSGRESVVRKLDALREEHGDAPAAWYAELTGEEWPNHDDNGLWTEAAE